MRLPSLLSMAAATAGYLMVSMDHADAFSMPTRRTQMKMMVGSLPNPFGGEPEPTPTPPTNPVLVSSDPADWDELDLGTPDGLIARAKIALSSDLGIQNGNLLADNFICIAPSLDQPLNKVNYLAAGRFFDLRSTFPDLDYRAHDYRIDKVDPFTVRVTARTVGTMRGELRLRDQTLPPNGQQMRCPPEAISITFDPSTGRIVKLCTGFAMDRLVGNTNGLCGVMAAATVAGEPPSDWEIYPPLTVAQRFFGRPVAQIGESTSFLAPFPETVMIQLAKGILSSNMAADDPSLLAKEFTYMTPTKGPIGKKKFLEEYAREEFAGVEPELSHFRVDPYDPNRVWVDIRPLAAGFEGPPQAMSFSFDDDGFCKRVTSSAVMDPSLGNAGGLGGPEGYRYAMGEASPGLVTRPIPRAVGRLGKTLLSPITGTGADDYDVPDLSLPLPGKPEESPVETLSTIKAESVVEESPKPAPAPPVPEKPKPKPPPPASKLAPTKKAPTFSVPKIPSLLLEQPAAPKAKKPAPKQPTVTVKKPAAKKAAPKKEAVPRRPSFSIPKIPTLSLSSTATPAKKPAPAKAKKPRPKKPTPKQSPAQKKEPLKVASPTFSIPKIPTLSLSTPSSTRSSEPTAAQKAEAQRKAAAEKRKQEAEAKKAEEQRRAEAKAKQKREEQLQAEKLKQQAEQRKQQAEEKKAAELKRQQQAAEAAKAKKELDDRRKVEAQEKRAAQAEALRQSLEAKKAEAAEKRAAQEAARRQQEEAKKAAAEKKRIEEEEKRAAQATARQQAEEARKAELERKRQAEEARKAELERKKQEAEQKRAEARKQQEEARKAELERKRKEAEASKLAAVKEAERKRAEAQKKKAAIAASSTVEKAKPGATINLFGLGGGGASEAEKAKTPAPKPRSTINLFGGGGQAPSESPQKKAEEAAKKAKPGATIALFGLGGGDSSEDSKPAPAAKAKQQRADKAVEAAQKAQPGATINLFGLGGGAETKPTPSKAKQASEAAKTVAKAKPGATINLFGLGSGPAESSAPTKAPPKKKAPPVKKAAPKPKPTPVKKAAPKPKPTPVAKAKPATAPRGVPTISGWRKNGDGSITGSIRGSPNFRNGEKVTTSPIASGKITSGSVVKTASGSKYFLS